MAEARELQQAVAVVILDCGKTLMIRRASGGPAYGYWTPITGRLDLGESLVEAARREVQEEVGLEVEVEQEVYRCEAVGVPYELIWYTAHLSSNPQNLQLATAEVAEARWCSLEEAAKLEPMFDVTRRFYEERAKTV